MKQLLLLGIVIPLSFQVAAQVNDQQKVNNLQTFARLYGYVRYFHPSDEAAATDWNRFLVYGIKKTEGCTDQQQLKNVLTDLFTPIAPTLQIATDDQSISFNKAVVIPPKLAGYNVIAWQHVGVGLSTDKRSPYQSARTNRPITYIPVTRNFGPFARGFDAKPYRNQVFVLTGRAKMVKGSGTGHFWARVDKTDNSMGFFNNMDDSPITTTQWTDFEITGRVDADAKRLVVGGFLQGDGEFWLDNLTLTIKDGGAGKTIYANNFNNYKTGVTDTGMLTNYPKSLYVLSIVADAREPGEKWVSIKSKEAAKTSTVKHTTLFKGYPAVGEYVSKEIGSGLKIVMPIALYGDEKQTYPAADASKLKQLTTAVEGMGSKMSGDSLYTRLADVMITWNVFQHFFLYFDFAKTDWLHDLDDALTQAYRDKDADDFQKNLEMLTAKLKDGHIRVNRPASKERYYLPITWEWVQNRLVITGMFKDSLKMYRGSVVTAIDGQSPQEYFKQVEQYISASTNGWMNYRAQEQSLLGDKGAEVKLSLANSDSTISNIRLKFSLSGTSYYKMLPASDSIKSIGKDIMYVNLGVASMKTINKALPQLKASKAIICDMRGYPNDNNDFIEYLLTRKDTATHWMQTAQVIYPDQEKPITCESEGWELKPRQPHLNAQIIYLIDGRAISWAESYSSIIEHYKLATIVGQPTAGTNGDVNNLNLPGGYSIYFTGLKVVKLDGSQHHGVGTTPDVYVDKTIKGIRENRDEFLEKAIEIANGAIR